MHASAGASNRGLATRCLALRRARPRLPRAAALAALLGTAYLALTPTAAAADARALGGFFDPPELTLAAGDKLRWTNDDGAGHTVTSSWDDGATFDATLRGGESFAWTFDTLGTFALHCRPHAYPDASGGFTGMVMTVHVVASLPHDEARVVSGLGVLVVVGLAVGALLASATRARERRGR